MGVNYSTSLGTAESNDFTAIGNTHVDFAPGETSKTVVVKVNGENNYEIDETFFLNLTTPTNATIADAQGVGTIINDDAIPTISINNITNIEASSSFSFTVTLSNPSEAPITVQFATADGTATAGADYVAASGTITFTSLLTSVSLDVSYLSDTLDEDNETFFVNLTNPTNATIANGQGVATITDNDPSPSMSISSKPPRRLPRCRTHQSA